jgi:hypothetical protein
MSGRYVHLLLPGLTLQPFQAFKLHTSGRVGRITADIQVLDGLLTYSRVNDPTFASGDGQPPKHMTIGKEGKADVSDGGNDQIIAELNGRVCHSCSPGL